MVSKQRKQTSVTDTRILALRMLSMLRATCCKDLNGDLTRLQLYYCCGLQHANNSGLTQTCSLNGVGVGTMIVRRWAETGKGLWKTNGKDNVLVVDAPRAVVTDWNNIPVYGIPASLVDGSGWSSIRTEEDQAAKRVKELLNTSNWKKLEQYLHPVVLTRCKYGGWWDLVQCMTKLFWFK